MLQATCSSRTVCNVLPLRHRAEPPTSCNHLFQIRAGIHIWRQRPAPSRRVRANGFFDNVFRGSKPHAPELVRLDVESEGGLGNTGSELFGPLAVLLVGFREQEIQKFRSIMLEMDADMVKIIVCDKKMFEGTVENAFQAPGHMHNQQVGERAVIVSGMNAAEVGEIIGAYRDSELPEPVWAAALAANWDRKVKDLVHDIYGDHRYMMERERQAGLSS